MHRRRQHAVRRTDDVRNEQKDIVRFQQSIERVDLLNVGCDFSRGCSS